MKYITNNHYQAVPFAPCIRCSSNIGKDISIKNTLPLEYYLQRYVKIVLNPQNCQRRRYATDLNILYMAQGLRIPHCLASLCVETLTASGNIEVTYQLSKTFAKNVSSGTLVKIAVKLLVFYENVKWCSLYVVQFSLLHYFQEVSHYSPSTTFSI